LLGRVGFQRVSAPRHRRLALAIRCDGGPVEGAGHVARCIPLAAAFSSRGWEPGFVGRFSGLAEWLLERAGCAAHEPGDEPCGLGDEWAAGIVDSYGIPVHEICAATVARPVATIAEARRCPTAGVVLDYHVDAPSPDLSELSPERLVAGPAYAPLDPALAAARRPRERVERILVTVGGSDAARSIAGEIAATVAGAFPEATLLVPAGVGSVPGAQALEGPTALVDVLPGVDLAVSAAGVTAYELACAGVPALVVALVDNQRRVARACDAAGIAVGVDGLAANAATAVREGLGRLTDPAVRASLAAAGPRMFDGHGARRAAEEIEARWAAAPPQ
jgi:spore coat polysaccharide biosynthesis predicted glycosyltransferase SpsG